MGKDKIDKYFEKAPEDQHQILRALRKLIHDAVPDVEENIKWSRPVFTTSHDFAYIQSNKAHVNLGFFRFSDLEDPENLLEGTGKRMRHVKVRSAEDIDPDLLQKWFKTAAEN